MNITIKNIKHAEFASEETNCFEATVYVDGKRSFKVSNDGKGGCDNHHPLKADGYKEMREIVDTLNAELGLIPIEGYDFNHDLDTFIGDLFIEWQIDKEIKKTLKKLCYVKGGDVYTKSLAPTAINIEAIQTVKWWDNTCKVLNDLPIEEVRQYFK